MKVRISHNSAVNKMGIEIEYLQELYFYSYEELKLMFVFLFGFEAKYVLVLVDLPVARM